MNGNNNYIIFLVLVILVIAYIIFKKQKQDRIKLEIDKEMSSINEIKKEEEIIENSLNELLSRMKTEENNQEDCKLNKESNSGECYKTKIEQCSLGSYEQCTNNNMLNQVNCDCNNRNSILCKKNQKLSEKCLKDNNILFNKKMDVQKLDGRDSEIRINNYNANIKKKDCNCNTFSSLRGKFTGIREVPQLLIK